MESLRASSAETPDGQTNWRLSIKQMQNIMKYQLFTNASKIIDYYRFQCLNDLFDTNLIFLRPELYVATFSIWMSSTFVEKSRF